jgi:hypothetical protein
MNPRKQTQVTANVASRDKWALYQGHRDRVTQVLLDRAAPGAGRLCVLGAGNCNDLDLPTLVAGFRAVHLVDLDAEALAQGVARQGLANHPAIVLHGDVDVTGRLDVLGAWSPASAIEAADVAAFAEEPVRRVAAGLPGPFDRVASVCLLSQLMLSLVDTVGEHHPRFVGLVQAARAGHLRLLPHLVAPGGVAILITDVVSSVTFAPLDMIADEALPDVLARLAQQHNHFHGVNPLVLTALSRQDPVLAAGVARTDILPPWRWNFGERTYAVWALRWHRRA